MRSFDASSAQKGMWLARKMSPDTLNHALFMWDVAGELDAAIMASAFRHVLDEAEVLRVTFVEDGDGIRQVPRALDDWQPFFLDLSTESDPEQAAYDAVASVLRQPFDLERDLLIRMGALKVGPARSLVVIAYHHLVSDGYGAGGLLSRRLAEVYTALVRDCAVPELPHPWDVESFAAEQAEYRSSQTFADDKTFWRTYLADAPAPALLPPVALAEQEVTALAKPLSTADRWSQLADCIGMASRTLTVSRAEADEWSQAAKSLGVWMSSLLAAAMAVYLRTRCDRQDFLMSMAVGNRVGVASRTPGLAVNVVPVRVKVPLSATFAEIADAMVDETYQVFGHTACHYSDIQRAGGTSLSGRGSFGAVINVVEFAEQLYFADSPARHLGATVGDFNELSIGVYTDGGVDSDLFLRLDAPASLYSGAQLRFIGMELIAFIRSLLAADPQLPVGRLDVVSGAERDRVLAPATDVDMPLAGLTVPELFARQTQRSTDAIALVSGDSTLTFRELDRRSSRVARALRRQGVGPETVVAVAMSRSLDLAVALLGVVKAGGAYLPVELGSSGWRTDVAGSDSAARLVLHDASQTVLGSDVDVPRIRFDELYEQTADDDVSTSEERPLARPDNLLAIMYGTGSVGAAVGVAVTHRNLSRLVGDRHWQDVSHGAVLWHSPNTHDSFALEFWVPLLNGRRVVVAPPGELDADALAKLRETHDVSTVSLSAATFTAIAAQRPECLSGLDQVWSGGDRVPAAAVARVRAACPDLSIVVGYGSTETTAMATGQRWAAGQPAGPAAATIGQPTHDTAAYVLGPGLAPVPIGLAGELYVAGPSVARGYVGRPKLTAQRFVACPFGPAGAVMYRTGDRVRWDASGQLVYLGRCDAQADIRGILVDTAETEEVLSEYPGSAQAIVEVRADDAGQRRLVAYVVAANQQNSGSADTIDLRANSAGEHLRRFAAGRLPEALLPSAFVVLERVPLGVNGRLDRAALPSPEPSDGQYRAPRNRTEEVLAKVFAEVLETDRVGIDDDFFDLGGNSLRAIRLVGLIRSELNLEVSIRTLFAARTIIGLSDMWESLARSNRPALRKRTRDGEVL